MTHARPIGLSRFTAEKKASILIPYRVHFDETTILTKQNAFLRTIELEGYPFETADDEDLDVKKSIRNSLLKGMSNTNIGLYFHIVRKKCRVRPNENEMTMPDGLASHIDQKWNARYAHRDNYMNSLYMSIVVQNRPDGIRKKLLRKLRGDNLLMKESYELLQEATNRVLNTLKNYRPRVLGIKQTLDGVFSEPMQFLNCIPNLLDDKQYLYESDDLSQFVSNNRLIFKRGFIEYKTATGKEKFAGIVSIKEYGPATWAGMLDSFLKMPFEFVISQSFRFSNRQIAMAKMQLQQNRMIQSQDKAISQIFEISQALDKTMSGEIGFGLHHLTIMPIVNTAKELSNALSMCSVEISNFGGIGIRERVNMEPAFWGQLPGNFDFIVRAATVSTMNVAAFSSLHNYPTGKKSDNHWGDALTVIDTASGTPYYFNFHLKDVGHTVIIGPTGSGKTILLNFFCAQAQKFRPKLFFFDKDRGAEIFIKAVKGRYIRIDPAIPCNFNPLHLPDTGENRSFLLEWLTLLVTVNGEEVSAEDVSLLHVLVNGNYKLDKKDRKLSNLVPFLGVSTIGSLASRIAMWHGTGSHAKVFDNREDYIDFNKGLIFGFEMGDLLSDKVALAPVLSYIFHRISIALDGSPTMIVLDEAWALIDNPVFAPKLKDWLKVLRKLNTFVVFATQSVEDASKSQISDTLIQQTATQIFLPNLRATDSYKAVFMLTEREFQLVKTTDPTTRYFLLKQGTDSVVARVDLSDMPEIVDILSGRADTVSILDAIIAQYGDDPDLWMPKFHLKMEEHKRGKRAS